MKCSLCWAIVAASAASASISLTAQEAAKAPADDTPPVHAKTAKGDPIDPKGQGKGAVVDQPARYFIWVANNEWRFRTAGPGKAKQPVFAGTIELSDGEFGRVRPVGIDVKGKVPDLYVIDETRRKIEFKFTTWKGPDGLDFTVAKTKTKNPTITFNLTVDGKSSVEKISVGKAEAHPAQLPFSLPAKP